MKSPKGEKSDVGTLENLLLLHQQALSLAAPEWSDTGHATKSRQAQWICYATAAICHTKSEQCRLNLPLLGSDVLACHLHR